MKHALAIAAAISIAGGCGKKSTTKGPPAEVTGLAAVPASAQVVIIVDVARVIDSPLVTRAVDVVVRDPALAAEWQKLRDSCKLDVKQFKHVVFAIGPQAAGKPGTGPILVVATGQLVENDFAACVRSMVGTGSGGLTAKLVCNHTLYDAKDGARDMVFAFGRPDTVVLGPDAEFVTDALCGTKKAADNPELSKWIALADQQAPIWAAGRADDRVRQGLVKQANGQITAGPQAIVASADFSAGAKLELGAVMASPEDAKWLESFAKTQLGLLAYGAQAKGLGTLVDKVTIAVAGPIVRFGVALDPAAVNQLISALDGGGGSAQGSPPP